MGGYALSYLDNEGDSVSITTDQDLLEAVLLARQGGRDKVDLFVNDPEKPPVAAASPSAPVVEPVVMRNTATSSVIQERRKGGLGDDGDADEEEEGDDDKGSARRSRKSRMGQQAPKEVIAGVPNEILLPGAIVTLAVVILGVFAVSRMSSR
jgi:hypothetical protein